MEINNIDHIVLTVKDLQRTVVFYTTVLGMEKVEFAQGRIALKFASQKINLHEYGNELEPKAQIPTPGSADLCFITNTPLQKAMDHVKNLGIEIIEGPVKRTGANSEILSFYCRDPDQNLLEIANEIT